ncbi:MAG: alpha/beta hydrolase [Myxococcales bacterium]|nr:alpha/beta hydrolase [Myxococcales bacterium]
MFESLRMGALALMLKLPKPLIRRLVGPPKQHQDAQLDLLHQWLVHLAQQVKSDEAPPKEKIPADRKTHEEGAAFLAGSRPKTVHVEERHIEEGGHPLVMRIYRPNDAQGAALVYFHGGGWVVGSVVGQDGVCARLAHAAKCTVISCGYRLAPEHPFPAAFEDALRAYLWIYEHAQELSIQPDKIGVGGDSAGGNLAAAVANQCKNQGLPAPKVQMLIYPATDLSQEAPSYELFGEGYFLSRKRMRWFIEHYAPSAEQRQDPRASVLLEPDLEKTSPAIVMTAEFDVLRDEGLAYVQRLQDAQVPVVHLHFPHLTHGSFNFAGYLPTAAEAFEQIAKKLQNALES